MTRQLKRTAIHEAGHAVMHYLERVPFERVTIGAASLPGADGAVHPRVGPLWLWDRQRPKTLRICMAGKVAEEFHTGRPVKRGCEHDMNLAGCIADELSSDADSLLAAAYVATRIRLTAATTWPAVEALASALVQRQALNARQAYRVIRQALPSTASSRNDLEGRGPHGPAAATNEGRK
jgi:hypothetical protein